MPDQPFDVRKAIDQSASKSTLQELAKTDKPILIRIDTASGHGASSQTKALQTTADIYSFIMFNMGLKPAVTGTRP